MPVIKKLILPVSIAMILVLAVGLFDAWKTLHARFELHEPIIYQLKKGSTLHTVASDLQKLGLLDRPTYFTLYARIVGQAHRIQAGEYEISANMNLKNVLADMAAGKVSQYQLTIIEGWSFKQLKQALNTSPLIQQTLNVDTDNATIMRAVGDEKLHPEGYFYPSTYSFPRSTTDVEFLKRAHAMMKAILEEEWQQREEGLPLKSAYEALILASIIEKETGAAEERALIASVFINRLRKKMRLQTDPTVIYGMGENFDGDIRFRDLRKDTPYNTYTRSGLPPTPIALPGRDAIHAALHPAKTNMLYFVAMGDGKHFFSATLAEHEAAVDQYQRTLRKRKRATKKTEASK